jgi:hypothetical protein
VSITGALTANGSVVASAEVGSPSGEPGDLNGTNGNPVALKDIQFTGVGTLGALSTSNVNMFVGIPYNQGASYTNRKLQVASATFGPRTRVALAVNPSLGSTPGVHSGLIASSGAIDLGGADVSLNFTGVCPQVGTTYTIVSTTGTLSGSFAGVNAEGQRGFGCGPDSPPTQLSYRLRYNRTGSPQTVTATVEPPIVTTTSTALKPVSPPVVSGVATVGNTLTAKHGTWSPAAKSHNDQWLRCKTTSPTSCTAIAGATAGSYRIATADVGQRLLLREFFTEANTQGGPPQVSALTAVVTPGAAKAQIVAALRKIGAPPSSASVASVLAKGATLTFTAPSAGALSVTWYQVPAGARVTLSKRPVLVAKGTRTVTKSGKVKLVVRLTSAGRRLLEVEQKAKRSLKLTGKASPKGGKRTTRIASFRLKR